MAGDPFSSHPYPGMRAVKAVNYHCEACDKTMRTADKSAHERGKKHIEKVAEKNSTAIGTDGNLAFAVAGGAPSDKACHNCHQVDHISRDCPQPRKDTRECHHCHEVGHAKADCPNKPRSTCFNCGEDGHRKTECPNERQMLCRNCDGSGHIAKECPEPPNPAKFKCNNCENMGHKARDCPEPKDWSKVKCNNCGNMGHTSVRCQSEPMVTDSSGWDNDASANNTSEAWIDSQAGTEAAGSWDDTIVHVEAPPTKSWDDSEEMSAPWESAGTNAAPAPAPNDWEANSTVIAAW